MSLFAIRRLLRLNIHMAKTEKELAFVRDLYIHEAWTHRFTDLVDKHLKLSKEENILYVNAGTGNHAFAIREKLNKKTAIFATCENEHLLTIARDKAVASKSEVDFANILFEEDSFDVVVTDGSFAKPAGLRELIQESERVARSGGKIAIFFPAAGSFGEIFSLLWEVLFNEDLVEHGAAVERIIQDLPTLSVAEEIAAAEGLINVETHSAKEVFEFENGAEFVLSPLVVDFLLPNWLVSLDEKQKGRVTEQLAQLIDSEENNLTFRFSVKAALLVGVKKFKSEKV